jgi:hypothetical protein
MTRLMIVLHLAGFTVWLGAALAMMVVGIAARREQRSALATVARLQAAIARSLVGPACGIAVATGLVLSMRMRLPDGMAPSIWLIVMQGAGILAAILVLAFMLPSYARLTRVNPEGEHAAYFDGLRRRQRIFGMISGMLALLALIAGGLVRLGM